jgi:hypothetical protein
LDDGIADTFVSVAIAARTYNEMSGRKLRGKSCGDPLRRPILVWCPQEREFGKEVFMGAHVIAGDPAIREDSEKDINGVISECAAIVREDRWPTGVVEEDVR